MLKILLVVSLGMAMTFSTLRDQQKSTRPSRPNNLATLSLENIHIQAQSIESFFSDLSLSHNIPIGLEIAATDNELAIYDIDFKKGTLADLLDQFVRVHGSYSWEMKDGVINIFPRDSYRDFAINELLKTEVAVFRIDPDTSGWKLVESLLSTPEVRSKMQARGITSSGLNFSGGYFPQLGRTFELDVSNTTVKSILNRVARDSQLARMWVAKKYDSDQSFFIRLKSLPPDSSSTRILKKEF